MSGSDIRMSVNRKEIAAKVIDGEAIIINLTNGTYYSMDNVGAAAWALIATGHSVSEVAARIAEHYGVDRSRAMIDMEALTNQLLADGLVGVASGVKAASAATPGAAPGAVELEPLNGRTYETPTLNKYSDLGDVLALDPPLPELK